MLTRLLLFCYDYLFTGVKNFCRRSCHRRRKWSAFYSTAPPPPPTSPRYATETSTAACPDNTDHCTVKAVTLARQLNTVTTTRTGAAETTSSFSRLVFWSASIQRDKAPTQDHPRSVKTDRHCMTLVSTTRITQPFLLYLI